jgi:sugar (pentulose or hexulose) kinase
MSYMGLDVGTTGSKAVVFGDGGRELARAYREYPTLTPREGWAERDSRVVSESCLAVIREAAGACASDPVLGLSVCSQGEAFTPLGPGGEILGNAMVSFDTRSAALAET